MSEENELKCRGLWIPIDVWNLLEEGKLSSTEVLLLAYIDGLVNAKGEGCWASNETIARKFNISEVRVRHLIRHLKEMKLVVQVGWKLIRNLKYRVLETVWSRTVKPELPVENNRSTPVENNRSTPVENNRHITNRKTKGEGGTGATPRPATPRKPHTSTGKHESGRNGYSPPNHQPQPVPVEVNGKSGHTSRLVNLPAPKKKNEWRTGDKPHHAAARKLHKALRDNGVAVDGENDDVWSIPFRQLTKAEIDYLAVLDWFCEHCSVEDRQKLKLPTITNGRQFQKRFEWIRDCMNKKSKKLERKSCNRIEDMYGVGDEFESSEEYYW